MIGSNLNHYCLRFLRAICQSFTDASVSICDPYYSNGLSNSEYAIETQLNCSCGISESGRFPHSR